MLPLSEAYILWEQGNVQINLPFKEIQAVYGDFICWLQTRVCIQIGYVSTQIISTHNVNILYNENLNVVTAQYIIMKRLYTRQILNVLHKTTVIF